MSKMKDYYINEMERKFSGIPPVDQNEPCNVCGKEFWKHKGCECPIGNEMEEPED